MSNCKSCQPKDFATPIRFIGGRKLKKMDVGGLALNNTIDSWKPTLPSNFGTYSNNYNILGNFTPSSATTATPNFTNFGTPTSVLGYTAPTFNSTPISSQMNFGQTQPKQPTKFGTAMKNVGDYLINNAGNVIGSLSGVAKSGVGAYRDLKSAKLVNDLRKMGNDPIATEAALKANAQLSMPDAYRTESGINERNVGETFDPYKRQIREAEAANRAGIRSLSGSQQQAAQQLLRNQSSKNLQQLADQENQARSQEKARVDEANVAIANRNAATMTQHAKDKAKFENEKVQRLTDAKLADADRKFAAEKYTLDYNNMLKQQQLDAAAYDDRTRDYFRQQGISLAGGLAGAIGSGLNVGDSFLDIFRKKK